MQPRVPVRVHAVAHAEPPQHFCGGGVRIEIVTELIDDVFDAAFERPERELTDTVRERLASLGVDRPALAQPAVVRFDRVP